MKLTTEKIPSANSTGAPYVAGNFAPLKSEVTAVDLEVIGRVPEELTNRFLRIGPNPVDEPDLARLARHHWFAGAGMAHGLRLRGGKAEWFRSRFVLDRHAAFTVQLYAGRAPHARRRPLLGGLEFPRDGALLVHQTAHPLLLISAYLHQLLSQGCHKRDDTIPIIPKISV